VRVSRNEGVPGETRTRPHPCSPTGFGPGSQDSQQTKDSQRISGVRNHHPGLRIRAGAQDTSRRHGEGSPSYRRYPWGIRGPTELQDGFAGLPLPSWFGVRKPYHARCLLERDWGGHGPSDDRDDAVTQMNAMATGTPAPAQLEIPVFLTAYDPSDLPGNSLDPYGFGGALCACGRGALRPYGSPGGLPPLRRRKSLAPGHVSGRGPTEPP